MERLGGMDASFVYLETPTAPMQVGMTCVFDPSTAPDGYSFANVRRLVEDRLHLIFPGPPFPLYCPGARMVAAYPMGPLGLGTALNISVQSYLDTLWFGIVACPDVVPEPWALADGIHDAVHELGKEHALRRG